MRTARESTALTDGVWCCVGGLVFGGCWLVVCSNSDLSAARANAQTLKTERDALINVNKALTKQRDLSQSTVAALESKIASTSNELTQSEQLNKLFTDDVKYEPLHSLTRPLTVFVC